MSQATPRILIIEDEHALAAALASAVGRVGAQAVTCFSGARARQELAAQSFNLVILDIGLPDINGLELLDELHAPALVITAHGNLANAIAARQRGAVEYLVKPLDLDLLLATVRNLLTRPAPAASAPVEDGDLLIGGAAAMQPVFVAIATACASDAPVLIRGPTGSGKSLAARVIHQHSRRRHAPFVTLHCAALPEQLLESELFGHEKGAFTGALTARIGHIERAAGGTLFLDEIGDITPAVQAKLLRFVEEKAFVRLGGRQDCQVDLRLIAATHHDLRAAVAAGRFREDLYYRLHVLDIEMPPLQQRLEDLPALSAFLLRRLAPTRQLQLAPETLLLLQQYHWPGNLRELRNALDHAVAVANGPHILPHHLPRTIRHYQPPATDLLEQALAPWLQQQLAARATYDEIHDAIETCLLKQLLRHFDHKPSVLARELQMNRATLLKRRKQLGLQTGD